jgi:hypothetical protein
LRQDEGVVLVKLCSAASDELAAELFEVVYPESIHPFPDEGGAAKKELRNKISAILFPKAAQQAVTFFTRDGGIRSLTEPSRFRAVKYCLFCPDSPVWKTSLRDRLFGLIRRGNKDSVIYVNARDFFNLLAQGLEQGIDVASKEDIATILSDGELAQSLWEAVTSRGIQYRMRIDLHLSFSTELIVWRVTPISAPSLAWDHSRSARNTRSRVFIERISRP